MKRISMMMLLVTASICMFSCEAVGPLVSNGIPYLLQGIHVGQKAAEVKMPDGTSVPVKDLNN